MKVMLMQMAVVLLNVMYLPFMLLKTKDKVSIISRQSDKASVDIRLLRRELEKRSIMTVVLTKRLRKSLIYGISYGFHMLRQMYHIATSRVIIVDGYCVLASVLHKRKDQRIVQMWHALGAVKKFGWQSVGMPGGNSRAVARVMKLHRNYDFVLAPGERTARIYSRAFKIGIEKMRSMGLPRIDYLMREDRDKRSRIYREYPQILDKETVLYVPTFRKNTVLEAGDIVRNFNFDKYNLVIKKHWLDKNDYTKLGDKRTIVDSSFNTLDWLKVCGKVITDYSAVAFEAALLDKEIYLYLPDVYEYKRDVGLNIDYSTEAIGTYAFPDATGLVRELEMEYDIRRVRAFKRKYIEIDIADCTGQLADFIAELLQDRTDTTHTLRRPTEGEKAL